MSVDCCSSCLHFTVAAEEFEREVPGFKVLSSAFGSVRGKRDCVDAMIFSAAHP
jgi:hypothetical protein